VISGVFRETMLSVPLRNVGPGAARIQKAVARQSRKGETSPTFAAPVVLASGEQARFEFLAELPPGRLFVELSYTDVAEAQEQTTKFEVSGGAVHRLRVSDP
jgi:hypothetical protein